MLQEAVTNFIKVMDRTFWQMRRMQTILINSYKRYAKKIKQIVQVE